MLLKLMKGTGKPLDVNVIHGWDTAYDSMVPRKTSVSSTKFRLKKTESEAEHRSILAMYYGSSGICICHLVDVRRLIIGDRIGLSRRYCFKSLTCGRIYTSLKL